MSCNGDVIIDNEPTIQIFISWSGMLEPVEVSTQTTPEELAGCIESGSEVAIPEHMQFVFKGLLLPANQPMEEFGVGNGSVLHLVLN